MKSTAPSHCMKSLNLRSGLLTMSSALLLAGPENSYRLQASDDLASTYWTDLLTLTKSGTATNFVDPNATNFSRRFYRLVSP
jgi:hypothetical protein